MDNNDGINPIPDLITDELYKVLVSEHLLSFIGIRDYQIRQKYNKLRKDCIKSFTAIEMVRDEYGYLTFDTIRKIVYHQKRRIRNSMSEININESKNG